MLLLLLHPMQLGSGMELSDGQKKALRQLHRIQSIEGSPLKILKVFDIPEGSNWLRVNISIDCRQIEKKEGGLALNDSESLKLYIHHNFPWVVPEVYTTHARFNGFSHVQWRRHLCVYLSKETQWDPSRGMFGFIAQVDRWLRKAAINELDDPEGPMHPPVAYTGSDTTIHSNVDVPSDITLPWYGTTTLNQLKPSVYQTVAFSQVQQIETQLRLAPTLLLDFELTFEYPRTVQDLFKQLESHGVRSTQFIAHLMLAAARTDDDGSMQVCIGAPSRGISGDASQRAQHLQFWEVDALDVKKLGLAAKACDIEARYQGHENYDEVKGVVDSILDEVWNWSRESSIKWCKVVENRPEIVTRRDAETPMDWFKGKSIGLWGCGALGSLVAEHLVRAGVSRLALYDNKSVDPGILVRQNYIAADLGDAKCTALQRRLLAIASEVDIQPYNENLYLSTLEHNAWYQDYDLIIDATASLRVRSKLEAVVAKSQVPVAIAAMMLSAQAHHGVTSYAPANHPFATLDIYRRLGMKARTQGRNPWVDAFWSQDSEEKARQPEPGCSDPTFVASHADVARLAAQMLNAIARSAAEQGSEAVGSLYSQEDQPGSGSSFRMPADITINTTDWQFRISDHAWRDMRGWIRSGARVRSPRDETGGLLFGQIDELLGIAWISCVSGPPADSRFDSQEFLCGKAGVSELCEGHKDRSGNTLQYVGTWHSHPVSAARPSDTDFGAIRDLFANAPSGEPYQVMVIVGYASTDTPEIGAYIFEQALLANQDHTLVLTSHTGDVAAAPTLTPFNKQIGLALSGGGSRAVAFHLGTLRALDDLSLLDSVQVVSGVSGGSVMTGILGYSQEAFAEMDSKTETFLQTGLVKPALYKLINPCRFVPLVLSFLTITLPRIGLELMSLFFSRLLSCLPGCKKLSQLCKSIRWPFRRFYSRTHVMADAIADVVGNQACNSPTRDNRNIVFNACELRTGTAFRMSNEQYGSWRYGYADSGSLRVADAIAASAAYPVALPAFEWQRQFKKRDELKNHRLLITDGGVFENLGVSVMEPGRSSNYSQISYSPEVIIASDAGMGQFVGDAYPSTWIPRMIQVVNSVMRKVQDATKQRLHKYIDSRDIDGFLYVNLGQQDHAVPLKPGNWVDRSNVIDYPTDFNAMSKSDIDNLANRAEAITRALATQYLFSE